MDRMDWKKVSNDELEDRIINTIHDLSKDGVAPTVRQFKANRPKGHDGVPDIVTILKSDKGAEAQNGR